MTAYEGLLSAAQEPADFVDAAGAVIAADLASGDVAVLAEMLSGARSVPGLAEQVAARLVAWEEFAQRAVADCGRSLEKLDLEKSDRSGSQRSKAFK